MYGAVLFPFLMVINSGFGDWLVRLKILNDACKRWANRNSSEREERNGAKTRMCVFSTPSQA